LADERLKSLIKEICNNFGMKCKFTRMETFAPMFFDASTEEIVINYPIIDKILCDYQEMVSTGNTKDFLENSIKHEYEHLKVLKELENRGIPANKQCRGDYVLAIEAYIENISPTFEPVREYLRDIILELSLINPTLSYQKARENAYEALTYVLFLSEEEIKAAFEMNYPYFSEVLLDLKKIALDTRIINDIPKSAEKIRMHEGIEIKSRNDLLN